MAYETVLDLDSRAIREIVAALVSPETAPRPAAWNNARSRIDFDSRRREFYSYGRHFPLARYIPRRGRRAPALWLINGDVWRGPGGWSSRTRDHQSATRQELERSGIPAVILPFSALEGSGIDPESMRILEVRPDANWTEYDALPDDVNLDALETAAGFEDFGALADPALDPALVTRSNGAPYYGDRTAGRRYQWRGASGAVYTRTLYRRAYRAGEYRSADPADFAADPAGAAVSESARLERRGERFGAELERRAEGWKIPRAMHRLGDSLFSAERFDMRTGETRRRAVYLSSFDYQEREPLYFIAELPRGAGAVTVETALDALAPRAVHAAYARGLDVCRQGDVFFIETRQTRETLAAAGATFARLTQWTRDAAPRAGEIGYRPPAPLAERRRRQELERRAIVRGWRELFRGAADRAAAGFAGRSSETAEERDARRAATRERFAELERRHAAELELCRAAGADSSSPESLACSSCGASIGEPCRPISAGDGMPESLAGRIERDRRESGAHAPRVNYDARGGMAGRQERELFELRRAVREERPRQGSSGPATRAGERRRLRKNRAELERRLEQCRESLRRAVFADASTSARYRYGGPSYRETALGYRRRIAATNARQCRQELERATAELAAARHARGMARDNYRRLYDRNAAAAMVSARHNAAIRYRPETIAGSDAARRYSERCRAAVSIFGTAHSATETARLADGRIYARGIVRHVPELEPGRNGPPDHRPQTLAGAEWYLAVRNTVPRQTRRRRRPAAAEVSPA